MSKIVSLLLMVSLSLSSAPYFLYERGLYEITDNSVTKIDEDVLSHVEYDEKLFTLKTHRDKDVTYELTIRDEKGDIMQRTFHTSFEASRAFMQFFSANEGYILLKKPSSANFSLGELYSVSHETITKRTTPSAQGIYFISLNVGYALSSRKDKLYITHDGAKSWQEVALAVEASEIFLPVFKEGIGYLAILSNQKELRLFTKEKDAWLLSKSETLSMLDAIPKVLQPRLAHLFGKTVLSKNHTKESINRCENQQCEHNVSIYRNEDVIQRFSKRFQKLTPKAIASNGFHTTLTAEGFDSCDIPSYHQMKEWIDKSPYSVTGLYLGGANLSCRESYHNNTQLLNRYFVRDLDEMGWKFIPTWVGKQAYCIEGSFYVMSRDADSAYTEGSVEAKEAIERLRELGLANETKGSVIYYDLEGFDAANNPQCLSVAQSFIQGWRDRLHANGILAGLYGSVVSSGIRDFYGMVDTIWYAHYSQEGFYASKSVFGDAYLSDEMWSERILQYANSHYEMYGEVGLEIDSNSVAGVVAQLEREVIDEASSTLTLKSDLSASSALLGVNAAFTTALMKPSQYSSTVGFNYQANNCEYVNLFSDNPLSVVVEVRDWEKENARYIKGALPLAIKSLDNSVWSQISVTSDSKIGYDYLIKAECSTQKQALYPTPTQTLDALTTTFDDGYSTLRIASIDNSSSSVKTAVKEDFIKTAKTSDTIASIYWLASCSQITLSSLEETKLEGLYIKLFDYDTFSRIFCDTLPCNITPLIENQPHIIKILTKSRDNLLKVECTDS